MTIHITDIQDVTPEPDLLTRMADTEYKFAMGQAQILFDFTCGVAVDLFGHGSKEHCAAIDRAREQFAWTQAAAATARDARIAELRAAIQRKEPLKVRA